MLRHWSPNSPAACAIKLDEAMMLERENIRNVVMLPSPQSMEAEAPLRVAERKFVQDSRNAVRDILSGRDPRLLVVVGPCSVHHVDSALEYMERLRELQTRVASRMLLVMRLYFDKPRTILGWKGLIYDPDLDGSCDIEKGLGLARRLLVALCRAKVPAATEFLDPVTTQYCADLISYGAIGARTVESQIHRQLASGLAMPIGFKNATDGALTPAVDAILSGRSPHRFPGMMDNGHTGIFFTRGNPDLHLILRGGASGPNYDEAHLAEALQLLRSKALPERVVVDCSHGNSGKVAARQCAVFEAVQKLRCDTAPHGVGNAIRGVMLESFLRAGAQKLLPGRCPEPGLSVTDECLGWEETEALLLRG